MLWPSGADAETAAAGLTYNLRIGTSPGDEEIMAASVATKGVRKVAALGNVGQNKLWALTNLVDWIYLGAASADTNSAVQFSDPSATNFNPRYYRLQSP